jgi:diadenosine tetraphosphate (Ap4A) HIT family hydrolase
MYTMQFVDDESWQEEICQHNDLAWELRQQQIQQRLEPLALTDALRYLAALHLDLGFLEDDLSEVRYFPCTDHTGAWPFIAQFAPRRAQRLPVGRTGRCAFDTQDFRRQQRGLQYFYRLTLHGRPYKALTNPYPFAPFHTSIASEEHEPQGWHARDPAVQRRKIHQIVADLLALAQHLPGWVALYNGIDAGATIDHLHFHVFALPPGHGQFPIQMVAAQRDTGSEAAPRLRFGGDRHYPLTAFRFGGAREAIVGEAAALLERWTTHDPHAATANLMAVTEGTQCCLYLVPRNRFRQFAAGFPYRVGSMEVVGQFIYSQTDELHALQEGRINFRRLWNILKAVHLPAAQGLA